MQSKPLPLRRAFAHRRRFASVGGKLLQTPALLDCLITALPDCFIPALLDWLLTPLPLFPL
jgi:hypothetical protein